MQPDQAWDLTPQEWWTLYSWKFGARSKKRGGVMTEREITHLRGLLDEQMEKEGQIKD